MAEIAVSGLAELKKALDQLPAKVEANIMRGAMRAGSKVMAEKAKEQVPVDSGDLRNSIRVTTRSRRGQVTATVAHG
ncbi:MAG: HK97 gp10 family phage protein [Betaproteobacteria bacterium]|nr:HK97 gp10 family phage protein [Betaproteobacteria bacterium]